MILRGIDFGPVLNASGTSGFFDEKYWYYKYLRFLGLNFNGCTFVAKTTTLEKNNGNLPLKKDGITPRDWFPECIKIYPIRGGGMVLNAVGLSGPGARPLFEDGRWQERGDSFFISFMSVAKTPEKRISELKVFVEMFSEYLSGFKAPVGFQLNCSCPNIGLDKSTLIDEIDEIIEGLKIADQLEIPLMPKFSIVTPVEAVKKISDSPYCDAICVSNSVPWGKLPNKINWKSLFGTNVSPLAKFGGGGLSGRPLFTPLINWILEARKAGIKKPINAGGGIIAPFDVNIIHHALTDDNSSISIGSAAILRPWNVRRIIKRAHEIFRKEKCDERTR